MTVAVVRVGLDALVEGLDVRVLCGDSCRCHPSVTRVHSSRFSQVCVDEGFEYRVWHHAGEKRPRRQPLNALYSFVWAFVTEFGIMRAKKASMAGTPRSLSSLVVSGKSFVLVSSHTHLRHRF
jgi:hypothetical protein